MTTTSGSAKWQGGIRDGKGAISTKSGALADYPYGFASRFEGKPGSNPEELIGAAHAACFTMALSLILGEAKLTAEHMETKADVTLEKVGDGFAITSVHLALTAKIPGADNAKFQELAAKAKAGCPVSKLLNTKITLDATRHSCVSPFGPTVAMRTMLVVPGMPSGRPATMITRCPALAKPSRKAIDAARSTMSS